MPVVAQLWRSPADVVALAAAWHAGLADRRLATVAGGPGWLRLTLLRGARLAGQGGHGEEREEETGVASGHEKLGS